MLKIDFNAENYTFLEFRFQVQFLYKQLISF